MYIAVWESQSPSPLALQKEHLLFAVLCVRYVALRSGSVSQTTMLLRLSRPYSYDPRPISKKALKIRYPNQPSCQPKRQNKIENMKIDCFDRTQVKNPRQRKEIVYLVWGQAGWIMRSEEE